MSESLRYSVVIPVYGNAESIPELVAQLGALGASLDGPMEAVFVIDGSPDDSLVRLEQELAAGALEAQVLELSRNFGSFSAIRIGLGAARGQFIAVMAADLQESTDVVAAFFRSLTTGDYDVAIGRRTERSDPGLSALSSSLYWRAYRRFINRDIPPGGVDVFGCTSAVAQKLAGFPESNTSLVALLFWVGYRRAFVEYERQPRHSGTSGWTLRKKFRYFADSVYGFTDVPIIFLQLVGAIGLFGSITIAIAVLASWLIGLVSVPGYTPIMLMLAASTSLILWALGVVGSYVWRGYENSKARPIALVMRERTFSSLRIPNESE